jgi:hypothetical protein
MKVTISFDTKHTLQTVKSHLIFTKTLSMALEALKAYIYQDRSLEVRESLLGFKIEINIFYLTNFKIRLSCSFFTILFKQCI